MKKYFIAVAALAFLAACNGKAAKDTPVLYARLLETGSEKGGSRTKKI